MLRHGLVLALLIVLLAGHRLPAGDDDEPIFLGKKLSYWLTQLKDGKDTVTRRRGLIAVERIGHSRSRKVVPALVQAMRQDKDEKLRAMAAQAVGRAVARAFEQAREDKKDELPRFDDTRDALASALRTEKAEVVREAAAGALGAIGPDARGAVGSLALALKDKHSGTVRAAATALRRIGKDSKEAQPELQELVGNPKAELEARIEAALALGLIQADVSQALPVMRTVLADAKVDVKLRKAVVEAVGKWGKEAADASPALGIVLLDRKTSPVDLRAAAVSALDQVGADTKVAVPALIKAIDDPDRVVRCLSIQTLGRLGKDLGDERKNAVKGILKATEASNAEVVVMAIETLGALSVDGLGGVSADVVKRLDTILAREDRKLIREAAQAARDKIRPPKKAKD